MKKIKLLILMVGFLWFNASLAQKKTDWEATNCYEKIEYRLEHAKNKTKRHKWNLVFKNNYNRLVTFNYGVTEEEDNYLSSHRKTLKAGEVSDPIPVYAKTSQFYILVDKLSFNVNGQPTIPCE